jgi:methionyl-tRNA synthetase
MNKVLITATPPTSNGDLHVGHLSGPYIAGDVFKRFCQLNGLEAWYVTGGDDNQSYLPVKSAQLGMTPVEVAQRFNDDITSTLATAQVQLDLYVRPLSSPRHREFVTEFVRTLWEKGALVEREKDGAWCEHCQCYLYEAHISGTCSFCGERADGNICEACARPNQAVDLIDAKCRHCGGGVTAKPFKRLYFPLAPYAGRLREYFSRVGMGSHLAALCEGMLADGLPEIPISHPVDWGIPVPVPGYENQRIYAWFEMAPGYLSETQEMLDREGKGGSWRDVWCSDDAEVVQFFGYDNGYFHAILFPAEMMAYDPEIRLPKAFVVNEFYRLDGLKFSTSRNHAIWGREALSFLPVDALRYFLAYDRPETEQSNFLLDNFRVAVRRELLGRWEPWLLRLGKRVREAGGAAPKLGALTPTQAHFQEDLRQLIRQATAGYRAESFSPQRVAATLNELVRTAWSFGSGEAFWPASAGEARATALALELAAARALAVLAAPILPGLAARLWSELGLGAAPGPGDWPSEPVPVPEGQRITGMEKPYFEGLEAGLDALQASRAKRAEAAA